MAVFAEVPGPAAPSVLQSILGAFDQLKLVIHLLTFSKHCILSTVGVKFYGQPIVIFTDNILLP